MATGSFADYFGVATSIAIGLLFFLHGARLSTDVVIAGILHWRLHLVIPLTTFVVFRLLGMALGLIPDSILPQPLYLGILFLCVLPSTVQSSIAFMSMAASQADPNTRTHRLKIAVDQAPEVFRLGAGERRKPLRFAPQQFGRPVPALATASYLLAAGRQDFHLDVRMQTRKLSEVAHQQVRREGRRQCHPQESAYALIAPRACTSAPAPFGPDDGTVAPWVVVAALPFAPEIVVPTVRNFARV